MEATCQECQGLTYREYESGLVRVICQGCNGTGVVAVRTEEGTKATPSKVSNRPRKQNKRKKSSRAGKGV